MMPKPKPMLQAATIMLALAGLQLSGCGKDKKAQQGAVVTGEVAPGTISDAMIPLDTVRSQAPLAPRAEAAGEGGAASKKPAAPADSQTDAAPSADGPADEPAEATPAAE